MILNEGTRARQGEVDISSRRRDSRLVSVCCKKPLERAKQVNATNSVSSGSGYVDVSHRGADLDKMRSATVSNRVARVDVRLVVRVVARIRCSERSDARNNHARALLFCGA